MWPASEHTAQQRPVQRGWSAAKKAAEESGDAHAAIAAEHTLNGTLAKHVLRLKIVQ